ncbi:MAG: M23 family peptidase [Alphaproteobacteria bacterium]|nr:M23 family peptidase [Alphaproteobacteria bacterium]
MSHRSRGHDYRADSGRVMRAHPAPRAQARGGFTLGHGSRQVRVGPVTFWITVGSLVVMAGWSLATGTYFAFKDDVLTRLLARQKDQQYAYEDRIAELRSQVDRITSRQLLDQERFEQKLEQITRRQAVLESRAATLNGVPDPTPTGSIRSRPAPLSDTQSGAQPKASPISDTVIFTAPPDREARLESRQAPAFRLAAVESPVERAAAAGLEGTIARLQSSLDRVETRQTATLNALEESYEVRARRIRSVLADLGLENRKGIAAQAAVGGPFVPLKLRNDTGSFERHLYRVNTARSNYERLARTIGAVPVRKPVASDVELSSGFGVRTDPFLRTPAMHTGLDFRGSTGDPVRATANGRVESAGANGGYGKMVELDHGNGFTTRYAHLSEIEVRVGQTVRIGQIVGRVGSTGRSTGPHLHYETRIDGEAIDPQKFLRAGLRLGNAVNGL